MIQAMQWDSYKLGINVGKLSQENLVHTNWAQCEQELGIYDLVLTRVPEADTKIVNQLEGHNFRFVGLDITLQSDQLLCEASSKQSEFIISRLVRSKPNFEISGFQIEDSRFMLDAGCRSRLPANFWDDVIREHCEEFADVVFYATDTQNRLAGFISCLKKSDSLDMFLVAVHPNFQRTGLGSSLVVAVKRLGSELKLPISTSVMASNVRGFNFYLKHHFFVKKSEVVMHRWHQGGT